MRKKKKQTSCPTIAVVYHSIPASHNTRSIAQKRAFVDGDTHEIVASVVRGLRSKGFCTIAAGISDDDVSALSGIDADFVINLVDSREMEIRVANALDRMRIPYSGSSYDALKTSNNKVRSKRLFKTFNIPTPKFSVVAKGKMLVKRMLPAQFPLMLKPAFDHCSIGISEASVVTSFHQLKSRVRYLTRSFHQALLLEEFIPGRELHVLVVEHEGSITAFPPAEMKFLGRVKTKWNIYGFPEKWNEKSRWYKRLYFESPARDMPHRAERAIKRDAIRAFYALGFRDYARFDVRYNPETNAYYFLEGNANPGLSTDPQDAFMASLKAGGVTFSHFLETLVGNAIPLRVYR